MKMIDANGNVKKPQQIASGVWNGLQRIFDCAKGYGQMFSVAQRCGPWTVNGKVVQSLGEAYAVMFQKFFGYGPTGPGRTALDSGRHAWHVAHALLRGEDVPEQILSEYAAVDWVRASHDREVDWIDHLLRRDCLRGHFANGRQLSFVMSHEGKPDCSYKEVTVENVGYLAGLLKTLPPDSGWEELDDLFYAKGILRIKPLPETVLPAIQDGVPFDKLAIAIYEELIKKARKDMQSHLEARLAQNGLCMREADFFRQRIAHIEREHSYAYPNRVAQAVQEKNVHWLVEILDSSINVSTQRAIRRVTGIEIERKASAQRIREIFRLVGYTDDGDYTRARALYDAQVATMQARQKAKKDLEEQEHARQHTKAMVQALQLSFDGKIVNGAEFIEQAIEQGYNHITTRKAGAVPRYYLCNDSGNGYCLDAKNGLLKYARLLLEQAPASSNADPVQ